MLDKDFGELAIVRGISHYGILRLVNLSTRQQSVVCLQVLALYADELVSGAIVTAGLGKVRIRPPDENKKESVMFASILQIVFVLIWRA
ncbi:MAG: hypothetical protein PUP92_37925 [Rhizonema sp. PD38]|nr:hypothetical protein [Rhizonema sp. PD38]